MFIKWLKDLSRYDTATAGGKGASLGELTRAGIPVPPGFVVRTDAFDRFLREAQLEADIEAILDTIHHEQVSSIERASEQIRTRILSASIPQVIADEIVLAFNALNVPLVAVRSSATAEDGASAAWAGQLESFLNTTEKDLLDRVKACWASLFTPRALFYRKEQHSPTQNISVAVVIQAMVQSTVSGIAFSVHPISEDRNQLLIEASYGLGEAIVSGQVTPDSYVVEKEPRRILEANVSAKTRALVGGEQGNGWQEVSLEKVHMPALSDVEIKTLADWVLKIEEHYGFPCDIEWAFEKNAFYMVQSRPITTLKTSTIAKTGAEALTGLKKCGVFERVVQFPVVPVLYIEAMLGCYESNPFAESLGLRHAPTTVYFMDEQIEGWIVPSSKQRVIDRETIQAIDQELLRFEKEAKTGLEPMILRPLEEYSTDVLRDALNAVNRLSTDIYRRFIFLTDELLQPSDEASTQHLQETRLRIDELVINHLFRAYEILVRAFTEKHGLAASVVERATTAELLRFLAGEEPNEEALTQRAIAFVSVDGELRTVFHEEAKAVAKMLHEQDPTRAKRATAAEEGVIAGRIGNKGKAMGRVRVLRAMDYQNQAVIDSLRDDRGYVLVTPMTRPELVPYIKNASAFVTDEGGITCHAAIIAREMAKPCVVATQFATQVLKDGDLVEVDADEGVVRVLSSASKRSLGVYSDHQTLFQVGGMPYLISDIFSQHYRSLDCLLVFQNNVWTSFLPRSVVQKTLADGVALYGDENAFRAYKEAFEVYKIKSREVFEAALKTEVPSKQVAEAFLSQAAELFPFYSKTEFFYTDQAFLASDNSPILRESLRQLEEVKNEGRAYLNQIYFGSTGYLNRYLEKLGREFGISLDAFICYSRAELLALFDGVRMPDETIQNRKQSYVIQPDHGGVKTCAGQEAFEMIEAFLCDSANRGDVLKGICANKGRVQGTVKVIFGGYDTFDTLSQAIDSMRQGDILVAETTSPELMLACKKAAAIVTNQGGLMSHAAIIAREMGIPCLVGTGNATKVLRDGDVIEVDAERGEVRRIDSV